MSRKVEVEIKVKLQMVVNEGVEIGTVIDEMEYDFIDTTTDADITGMEIIDYEVRNSK